MLKSTQLKFSKLNKTLKDMSKIKWYLKYAWYSLNILVLTPLVWLQSKYEAYKEWRLRMYVNYQAMIEQSETNK